MRPLFLAVVAAMITSGHIVAGNSSRDSLIPTTRFTEDMQRKEIDDILSLYAPNAVFVDPNLNEFKTPEELRELYQQVFATYDTEGLVFEQMHTVIRGSYRSEIVEQAGFYSENLRTRATDEVSHLCGGYHVIYEHHPDPQQTDGPKPEPHPLWLIVRQEWTSTPCSHAPVK